MNDETKPELSTYDYAALYGIMSVFCETRLTQRQTSHRAWMLEINDKLRELGELNK